jgi:hypothetical protein
MRTQDQHLDRHSRTVASALALAMRPVRSMADCTGRSCAEAVTEHDSDCSFLPHSSPKPALHAYSQDVCRSMPENRNYS